MDYQDYNPPPRRWITRKLSGGSVSSSASGDLTSSHPQTPARQNTHRQYERVNYVTPTREYQTPNTDYQTPIREYQTPNTDYQTPTREYQTPNTDYQTPTREYQPPAGEYQAANGNCQTGEYQANRQSPATLNQEFTLQSQAPSRQSPATLNQEFTLQSQAPNRQSPATLNQEFTLQSQAPNRQSPATLTQEFTLQSQAPNRQSPATLNHEFTLQNQAPSRQSPATLNQEFTLQNQAPNRQSPARLSQDFTLQASTPNRQSPARLNHGFTLQNHTANRQSPARLNRELSLPSDNSTENDETGNLNNNAVPCRYDTVYSDDTDNGYQTTAPSRQYQTPPTPTRLNPPQRQNSNDSTATPRECSPKTPSVPARQNPPTPSRQNPPTAQNPAAPTRQNPTPARQNPVRQHPPTPMRQNPPKPPRKDYVNKSETSNMEPIKDTSSREVARNTIKDKKIPGDTQSKETPEGSSKNQETTSDPPKDTESPKGASKSSEDYQRGEKPPTPPPRRSSRPKHPKKKPCQSIQEIIQKLQCGLHENEVWALCRECVLALQRTRHELPDYISLETVALEETGRVVFLSIPEDQELEVIYLAPELQRNGVVTERTCIYGIAAMLFLAADYNMPQNQEPALSEELDNLLLKMASEDERKRPGCSLVLQTCNEYQKKQEISSTKLCQTTFNEAHKAEEYGRENVLVRDFIDKEIQEKAENTKAIIVDSIKLTALQSNLKPVSERKLNEKKVIKTKHEKLIEEISNPPKKLRKSSKPKEFDVKLIFLHNAELMQGLLRVTGIQQIPISADDVYDNPVYRRDNKGPGSLTSPHIPQQVYSQVPNAFNSPATHFSPIVLDPNGHHAENDLARSEKDKKVVKSLKELKRNLVARGPLNLARDLEKDASDNRTPTPRYRKSPAVSHDSLRNTPTHGHVTPSQGHMTPLSGHYISMYPGQASPYQNLPMYNAANGQIGVLQGQISPPTCTPTVTSTPTMPNPSMFHGSMPDLSAMTYQNYALLQAQLQAQGQMQGQMQGQFPSHGQFGMPVNNGMFQMQLQQDPRTGLIQLVPVQVNQIPLQNGVVPNSQGHFYPPQSQEEVPAGNGYVTYNDLIKALQLKDKLESDERSEKRRFRSNAKKVKGRSESMVDQEIVREALRNSQEDNIPQPRTRSRSRDKGRSRTLSSLEIQTELEKVLLQGNTKPKSSNVKKATSMEMLNEQKESTPTSKTRQTKDSGKARLKRAKSGSSIDYRHLEFRIKDIPIDEPGDQEILSKSHSNLDYEEGSRRRRSRQDIGVSPQSQGSRPTSPSSPSLSKDSGVSDLKSKTGDASLMERLLNPETIRHQQKLSVVVRLLRQEFAYDGYMENGIEDLAMAEYILSLGNLKWETFNSAVTEKYCDLYWSDELLANLYEAVNGCKPYPNNRHMKSNERLNMDNIYDQAPSNRKTPSQDKDNVNWGGSDSAFRPIISNVNRPLGSEGPVFKPRAQKSQTYSDDSSGESDAETSHRRHYRKKNFEKIKSNSMHELLHKKESDIGMAKSLSDDALLEPSTLPKMRGIKHESDNESFDSNTNATINSSIAPHCRAVMGRGRGGENTPGYNYLYRYDSDSSSASEHRNSQNIRRITAQPNPLMSRPRNREDMLGARQGTQNRRYITKSETQINRMQRSESSDNNSETREPRESKAASSERRFSSNVIYYCAEVENKVRPDVNDFSKNLDSQTRANLEAKMSELDQQMVIEMRMRRKTAKFYNRLMEATKTNKATAEQKTMLSRMTKQLSEMNMKLDFLDAAKKHLEMLHADQWGLPLDYLHSIAKSSGDAALRLQPSDNPLIQFQVLRTPEGTTDSIQLQAGTPEGLMSYLFARNALSVGYIHHFFYCYRYFTTPNDLFMFLRDKYQAASYSTGPDVQISSKVKVRALDLIQVWLEGYYSVDFKHCPELTNTMYKFIKETVLPVDNHAEFLLELMEDCQDGRHNDLYFPQFLMTDDQENLANHADIHTPKKALLEGNISREVGAKWESFKAALHLSAKPVKMKAMTGRNKPGDRRSHAASENDDIYTKLEAFMILDYSPQELAEQLTLMQQEDFLQSHPVHYLNSKAQGIGVALANNHQVLNKDQSQFRFSSAWEDSGDTSLFVGTFAVDDIIQRMIEHAQEVSYWVAAEILSCSSSKTQAAILTKFIIVAKLCHEMRNYASCISILDGLDNIIVKQVPAWKNLTSKCGALMEELASVKVFLKTDSQCLLGGKEERKLPTIPCILLFLLHVQQLEIGGFRLANGMYKWTKMKKIATVIDQIRMFRECRYPFSSDKNLQGAIWQRIRDLGQQDLHALASQHDNNYTKLTPSRFQGMFRRIKKNKQEV